MIVCLSDFFFYDNRELSGLYFKVIFTKPHRSDEGEDLRNV